MEETKGKPGTRAKNKYNTKAYDRINLVVKKGRKAEIAARANSMGKSVNAYLIDLIDADMDKAGE